MNHKNTYSIFFIWIFWGFILRESLRRREILYLEKCYRFINCIISYNCSKRKIRFLQWVKSEIRYVTYIEYYIYIGIIIFPNNYKNNTATCKLLQHNDKWITHNTKWYMSWFLINDVQRLENTWKIEDTLF